MNRQTLRADDARSPVRGAFADERKHQTVNGYAEKSDYIGTITPYLRIESFPALDVFDWPQIADPWAWPRDEVRQTKPPFRQTVILLVIDGFGHESRIVQQLPKAIREPGKMVAGYGGPHAWVDADKQNPHAWLDPVFEAQRRPVFFLKCSRLPRLIV